MYEGRQRGVVGVEKILELPGAAEAPSFFRRGARIIGDIATSPASTSTTFYGSGRVRGAVDGSGTNVCLYWEQG